MVDDLQLTKTELTTVRSVEATRILLVIVAMILGYSQEYRVFAGLLVISLSGITGMESLLIGEISAKHK